MSSKTSPVTLKKRGRSPSPSRRVSTSSPSSSKRSAALESSSSPATPALVSAASSSAVASPRPRGRSPKRVALPRSSKTSSVEENVVTTEFEFFGPFGAFFLIPMLPLVCYALFFLSHGNDQFITFTKFDLEGLKNYLNRLRLSDLLTIKALLTYIAWVVFQVVLMYALPGKHVQGLPLKDGSRLTYKVNGLYAYVATLSVAIALNAFDIFKLSSLYDMYLPLLTASFLFSFALSVYLFASAVYKGKGYAAGGNSGDVFYDFWIGRELNPRIGSFDIKYFCELRPGLFLWVILDLAFCLKAFEANTGATPYGLYLITIFHAWYVWDAVQSEQAILSTMDITTDGFGYMLAFGDLTWVPFTFSTQCRYLVDNPRASSPLFLVAVIALKLIGYYFFRGANSEKDAFRRNPEDPSVKHLKYITTKTGRRLLTSGFWGMARHVNYFGDWIMALAWCLPAGFESPIPYFYLMYFIPLLIHREMRDEHNCHKKYGSDWEKYKSIVKYRIIPGVY